MLEREVVLRSLKHIINEHLRENQFLSQTTSHILNCVFATKEFSKKMDNK